jgi:LPXTG-motif cell wall-anchored protein
MAIFGKEKARKNEAEQSYTDKYALSNSVEELQKTIGFANIELINLKNSKPATAGAKRIRQRNITALSNRILQLNNNVKDLRSGLSNQYGAIVMAPPTMTKLPIVTSDTLLRINPINRGVVKLPPLPYAKTGVVQNTDVRDLANTVETTSGTPVDAAPIGTQGDFPPPQGVQGSKMNPILLYGGLAVLVGAVAYFMLKKKN